MSHETPQSGHRPEGEAQPEAARPTPSQRKPTQKEVDALADEITLLAGQIAAATARFLALLGRFDDLGCWGGVGIRSLAHWLSFRAGMSLRTAREHIRVARALKELPMTAQAFEAGELSFSKVRALSRVATPENEESLVTIARKSPAAHVERLVAGLRKVKRDNAAWERKHGSQPGEVGGKTQDQADLTGPASVPSPEDPPPTTLQWRWDEDTGDLVVWGRVGAADGRLLLAALTRAELERVRTLAHESDGVEEEVDVRATEQPVPANGDVGGGVGDVGDVGGGVGESVTGTRSEAVDRTAPPPSDAGPALVALARLGLSVQDAPAFAPAAEVIYLHQLGLHGSAEHSDAARSGVQAGVVSADDGPSLEQAAGEEVMCGARGRCMLRGAGGAVLGYGRSRRLFSATQLKALHLRDRCCRTPGCQRTRFLHAHHVVYWWEGGRTDLDNAILLCSSCHRAVHLGRLTIRALGGQRFEFVDVRTGKVMADAPPLFGRADHIMADRTITARTITGGWWGEPLDLSLATAMLLEQWRVQATRLRQPGDDPTPPWDDLGKPTWKDPDAPHWGSAA